MPRRGNFLARRSVQHVAIGKHFSQQRMLSALYREIAINADASHNVCTSNLSEQKIASTKETISHRARSEFRQSEYQHARAKPVCDEHPSYKMLQCQSTHRHSSEPSRNWTSYQEYRICYSRLRNMNRYLVGKMPRHICY